MPKGRDKALIAQRNADIYKRYKYLMNVRRLRYSAVFEQLSREFYLSVGTITHIIREAVYQEEQPAPREFSGFRRPRRERSSGAPSEVAYEGELFAEEGAPSPEPNSTPDKP